MKGTQRDVQANAGCGRRVVKRAAPGWALALVLTGLGAGAIAAGAESGGHGAGRGESGIPVLDQRRCPQCPANSPADTGASMQPGPGRATKGAEPGGDGHLRVTGVPRSAMNALFPLGAARYVHRCKARGHLCDLIAAHLRAGINRTAPTPSPATAQRRRTPSLLHDAARPFPPGVRNRRG